MEKCEDVGESARELGVRPRAMGRSAGRDVQFGAAPALAYVGDDTRARELSDDLAKRSPRTKRSGAELASLLKVGQGFVNYAERDFFHSNGGNSKCAAL